MKDVEFLPDRIRQQRARKHLLVRQGYLLAACVVAMAVHGHVYGARIAQARGKLATLDERAVNLNQQIQMIGTLEKQLADLMIKKRIDEELGSRADCTAVLAELCRITPPNMALVSLEMKAVDVEVKSSGGSGRSGRASAAKAKKSRRVARRQRLVITGLAPTDVDVANFIGQLAASCVFEDVTMGYARSVLFQDRTAREFQASCHLAR